MQRRSPLRTMLLRLFGGIGGHTEPGYSEDLFLYHLHGGIESVAGGAHAPCDR